MNVFLTGVPRVGKSTIIQKYLTKYSEMKIGGFRTVRGRENDLNIYIVPADKPETPQMPENLIGIRAAGKRPKGFPETFDRLGPALLDVCDCDLILMDELGFMESEALTFQQKVLETLDGDVPVLGVIKPQHTDFLDAVRAHPKTLVFEVDKENRDTRLADIVRSLALEG